MAKKFTSFELDKVRNLRYGMVALTKIEKKLGKSFVAISFVNDMKYEELAIVIWGGLVHEDDSLTPEKVAELIDDYSDISTAMEKMSEAMAESFGGKKQEAEVENPQNGTGTQP